MSDGFQSAEKMFWKTPELVDKLIHFLNAESVSRLAEVHQLTAQVLQDTSSTWNKLVKRNCPYLLGYYEHVGEFSYWAKNSSREFEQRITSPISPGY